MKFRPFDLRIDHGRWNGLIFEGFLHGAGNCLLPEDAHFGNRGG